jgi:hypothetical protein
MLNNRTMLSERDHKFHAFAMAVAKAMFADRLHVLRLTEIVRHHIRPNEEGLMILPPEIDEEMKKQAFEFVLAMMPEDLHVDLVQRRSAWLTVQ